MKMTFLCIISIGQRLHKHFSATCYLCQQFLANSKSETWQNQWRNMRPADVSDHIVKTPKKLVYSWDWFDQQFTDAMSIRPLGSDFIEMYSWVSTVNDLDYI